MWTALALGGVAAWPLPTSAQTATQLSYGFEPEDSAAFTDVNAINIVTEPVNSGTRAMQAGTNGYRSFAVTTTVGQTSAYRVYARWAAPPSSGMAQLAWLAASGGGTAATIRVDSAGKLSLRGPGGAAMAQTTPLTTSSWHLIEFAITQNGDGTGVGSLRVDGADVATNVAGNYGTATVNRLRVGQIGTTALPGLTEDDIAVGVPGGPWIGPVAAAPPPPPPPATQFDYGYEDDQPAPFFQDVGTVAIVSDPVHSGLRAAQPQASTYRSFHTTTTLGQPTFYRFYARWDAVPSSGLAQLAWIWSDASRLTSATVRVDSSGRLSLRGPSGTALAQTGPLAASSWHRVEFGIIQNGDGSGIGSLRVDGSNIAINVVGNYGAAAADRLRLGQIGATALPGITEDDVAVSQPGASWIGPVGG